MNYSVVDMETDGLIDTVTKIHCVSICQVRDGVVTKFSLVNADEIINFFETEEVIVGHNIIRYDLPVLRKLLGIIFKGRAIDTLGLSWYLYPNRHEHGLEAWGIDLGVEKPKIADWSNLTVEEYIYRCEQDIEINYRLFIMAMDYLMQVYDGNFDAALRLIGYLMYKLDCAREQEEIRWKIDVNKCQENLEFLKQNLQERVEILKMVMPKVIIYKNATRPKVLYKKDGTPSVVGQKWLDLLKEKGYPDYHIGTIKVPVDEEVGNPGSHAQLKAWLFSLGWIPETFKYNKDKHGVVKKVPQINTEDDVCDSVKRLYDKAPDLEHLEGFFKVRHRIGLLEGFLRDKDENNFVIAAVKGFTNTLRFQHTVIANLPTIPKLYWEKIRECLIAPNDDYELCGSDMSGLEDNTKRHYMYYYDPEYVKEMMEYAFDAHCDIAVLAKKMSRDEQTFYKWYTAVKEGGKPDVILSDYTGKNLSVPERIANSATGFTLEQLIAMTPQEQAAQIKILKPIRLRNKKVNFGGVYGAGAPKLALTGNMPLAEAKVLHGIYWQRNWSVKKIAANCVVKTIGGQMWLLNPVSQFWYSLRVEKDKFSTLNQGTGVYCFDTWTRNIRKQDVKICGQFHDEVIIPNLKTEREILSQKLRTAIAKTNDELRLNVQLGISIDYGNSYADIH